MRKEAWPLTEEKTTSQPGWSQRIAALPPWVRMALLAALVAIIILLSKWLVLLLLLALGLWPITLLIGLGALALVSTRRGGWPWMKEWLSARFRGLVIPALAVLTALAIGAIVLMLTDQAAYQALGEGRIGEGLGLAFGNLARAYGALYEGALGSPFKILVAIGRWLGGEGLRPVLSAVRGPSDSMVQSVPYIFAGLAVALGFRAGLFNIGAEGQIGIGWLVAAVVGFAFAGLPAVIHLPLAILAGAVGAGLWAAIAGFLKARTGAHEVITTIMLNYIVFRLSEWLLCGPLEFTQGTCRTQEIAPSAYLPRFLDHPVTIHWGFVLALAAAAATAWFLFKTTWGFELRTAGANPDAARYGGMNVAKTYVVAMFLSGCLAGLGGVVQGLGITHNIALGFQAGYGFDSIALALLGKSHPAGVVGASILFGVLRAGAGRMQSVAGIPTEIVQIVQSLVIVFIAAPAIIQAIYRLREARREEAEVTIFSRGWGA
jgi:simple sugar transport system permease protein